MVTLRNSQKIFVCLKPQKILHFVVWFWVWTINYFRLFLFPNLSLLLLNCYILISLLTKLKRVHYKDGKTGFKHMWHSEGSREIWVFDISIRSSKRSRLTDEVCLLTNKLNFIRRVICSHPLKIRDMQVLVRLTLWLFNMGLSLII